MQPKNPVSRRFNWSRNFCAYSTFALAMLYYLIERYTHRVIVGVIPILLTARSYGRKERLFPLALISTLGVILLWFIS